MRIKKGQQEEEIIDISKTFENIAARNLAVETLKDGDLVKVIDASQDIEIQSGWAVYRFQKSSNNFDLIEKEIKWSNDDFTSLLNFKNDAFNIYNLPNLKVSRSNIGFIELYPN